MAQQILNISTPNSGLGDALRDASIKSNDNFTELYEGKVDKVVGKDLSDNNFTDAFVTKINDLEAEAQVNVQSDWNENDILADAFIKNKPTQLLASLGYFDYADLATQTTPITVSPNTQTLLTNDTLGDGTDISQPPYAVNRVYEGLTANEFDFSQLSVGDTVDIRFHFKVTTSANNQLYHIDLKAGIGSASEFENRIFSSYVKTAGVDEQTFVTTFYVGSNDIKDYPAQVFITSTQSCTVEVVGWFVRVFRKSINVVDILADATLQEVSDNGGFDNGSTLRKGTTNAGLGGNKGIALRCSVDYELKWEAGRLYVMEQDGFTIREVSYNFINVPTITDDSTKGFVIGSRWILDNGNLYVCEDDSTGSAVWELQTVGVPDATTSVKGIAQLATLVEGIAGTNNTKIVTPLVLKDVTDLIRSDISDELNTKVDKNTAITGATKTKITYDAKGLVTSGDDATTTDITEGSNLYFTTARVLATLLTGISFATGGAIVSTDSVLIAFGKIQKQLNDILTTITGLELKAVTRTTSVITFDAPAIYNSFTTPQTAVLTSDLTGARIGVVQVIYLNRASFTPPAGWVNIGSASFQASVVNIIYAKWSESARVEYWLSKSS